jgi:ketopantoate reductase
MSLEIFKRTESVTETPSPQDKVILISDAYILNEYLNNYRKYAKKKTKQKKTQNGKRKRKVKLRYIYIFYLYSKMFLTLTAGNFRIMSKYSLTTSYVPV